MIQIDVLEAAVRVRQMRVDQAQSALSAAQELLLATRAQEDDLKRRLADYDAAVAARINAFYEKVGETGISPGGLQGAKAFHGDIASRREQFFPPLQKAGEAVAMAEGQVAKARAIWSRADRALQKMETARDEERLAQRRENARREDREAEELALLRAAFLSRIEGVDHGFS